VGLALEPGGVTISKELPENLVEYRVASPEPVMQSDDEEELIDKLWGECDERHAEWRKAVRRRRDGTAKPGEVEHYRQLVRGDRSRLARSRRVSGMGRATL
jgi:hypothetical protein